MKSAVAFAFVGICHGVEVTPVQKVLQLMNSMLEKGKKEKHEEQTAFAGYKQFCDDTTTEKNRAINEANDHISVLKADIEKAVATIEKLASEIAELEEDVSIWEGDIKAATKVREIEKADYDKTHADYSESVDALERAIKVLKDKSVNTAQASLLQLKSLDMIPANAKNAINVFLQQDPEFLENMQSPPESNAYEGQSSGIIEMLDKLLDKFVEERTQLEKDEMNGKHAYDMLLQDLKAQIAQSSSDRDEKAEFRAETMQAKADAESDVEDTTSTRDSDMKYLEDLTATCSQKASDFDNRQQLRSEEIEAIEKAIEIIGSGAVAGNADKHLPAAMVQTGMSFAQLRSSNDGNQARVAQFLQAQSEKLGSHVLSLVAQRIESDPFVKVKKMIKDLITKLMEEAAGESEHKGWCDTELSTNEQTRKEKTAGVEALHAQIDELEASIAKLTEDIANLNQAISDLNSAIAKATELRNNEKTKNTDTIADSKEAQTAVAQALAVLKDFYAKAATATSFIQGKEDPEIFESEYKGMQNTKGGVVGMLEVIESDFARLEAETKSSEASAQKEYDEFMADSKSDKDAKAIDIEHKTAKKQDESQALQTAQEDLAGTQEELDAALDYFDKLKPSCVDAGVSYEDRVARRKEEIASLQQALEILDGKEIA